MLADLPSEMITWMRSRGQVVDSVYHPRKTDVSDFIRRKFLSDLLSSCPEFRRDAQKGLVVCDLNVSLSKKAGRTRKLDLVLGAPLVGSPGETAGPDVLRKAKVEAPYLTLETKLCMTEHRKATSRLIDELLSSLDVVRAVKVDALCVAIVVVNVAERFTSPLNLPGPNLHDRPIEIHRLIAKIFERVPIGGGGYDALAMALIDVDNERRFEVGSGIEVPERHRYGRVLEEVGRKWQPRTP